jgi:hypothetical protein
MHVSGIGEGEMVATEQLSSTVKFRDGKSRILVSIIVPELPYSVIVGLDFMAQEGIGFVPNDDGIELFDNRVEGGPIIYSGIWSDTEDEHQTAAETKVGSARISQHRLGSRGKKSIKRYLKRWNGMEEADRDLVRSLACIKLTDLSEKELNNRLNRSKLDFVEKQVNIVVESDQKSERMRVPKCDFPECQQKLEDLVDEFPDVFSSSTADVGKSTGNRVTIRLAINTAVNVRNYRTPLKLRSVLKSLIGDLLEAGVIEKCESNEFNSPVLLVPKKSDGTLGAKTHRMVVDYRALNKIIETVVYPMPRIKDILNEYNGCKVFSYVDICHAFYTIQLDKASRKFTAFSCELGKFQFRFLPQGLKIAPAVFQQQISKDLEGLVRTQPYMDDILAGDLTAEQGLSSLRNLFARLQEHGYKLSLPKCKFLVRTAVFAGSEVSEHGVGIAEDKISAAARLTVPKTMSEVKSLLGFCSFLRDHVPYYCEILGPIQDILSLPKQSKSMDITPFWTSHCQRAFDAAKSLLCNKQILAFPDSAKDYVLYTDASNKAMSAVLFQAGDNERLHPISYWSKSFKGSQRNWAALVKEARAVLEAVQHYAVYLTACHTTLRCDHKPLARFLEARTKNEMVNRWSLLIQEFEIEFEWVCSEDNMSDCLSRLGLDDLISPHDTPITVDTEFPPWPQSAAGSVEVGIQVDDCDRVQVNGVRLVNGNRVNTGNVFPAAVVARRDQQRRTPSAKEEAELLGVMAELSIKDITKLTNEQVKYLQSVDNFCKRIMTRLDSFTEHNGVFHYENGLLYKQYVNITPGKERLPGLALVVPKCLTLSVILNLHKELKHAGRDKMLAVLRTRVYWKHMNTNVAEFVKGCRICQFRHLKNNKYQQMRIKPPRGPGLKLAVDVWSSEGKSALTCICMHSSYPFAEQIPNKESSTVCNALQNILSYIRSPVEIVTDNGGEFTSNLFTELMKSRNIRHRLTAPYSPPSNGMVERLHGYLNSVVTTTLHLSREGDWWPAVRGALETYRKMPHTSSGESPLFLFMGQEPTYTIDHLLPTLSRQIYHVDDNRLDLQQLHTAYALARKNLCLARRKSKCKVQMFDDSPLQIGDRVYRQNFSKTRTKTDLKWLPGFRIVDFQSVRTAVIEHTETKVKSRVNVRHLRWADPVSELIYNSNIDVFPGCSKLYFTASDLDDLNWEALEFLPELEPEADAIAAEILRDRSTELTEQEPPPSKRNKIEITPDVDSDSTVRPKRKCRHPVRYKDFICGFTCTRPVRYANIIRTTPLTSCLVSDTVLSELEMLL